MISLTFDDGTADQLSAARLLAERGLAATFYVNSGRVGSDSSYLDWGDLAEVAAAGHEIGSHTVDHVDLTRVAPEVAHEHLVADRRALAARGFPAHSFAYPYGARSPEARSLVVEAGYASARRAWGLAADGDPSQPATESLPPLDAHAIRTVPSLEHGTTLEQLQRVVLRAEHRGGWLPLVFHGVGVDRTQYDVSEALFRTFVDWLHERRGGRLAVRTVGDVMQR
ncbi:MAG TPA: polysaccharide deacetylase family protein [Gaiellaceae bacterium]|nr:polysaccharide deacetylase family protein [Gaiellaceae bacterium]